MNKFKWIPIGQLTLAVGILILYLTILPKPFEENILLFPGADKIAHCCMFGGLALTHIFEHKRAGRALSLRQAFVASTVVTVFGISIEFIQELCGLGRSGDWLDAIADTVGAFAAIPLCLLLHWINIVVKNRS